MTIYHASNVEVKRPMFVESNRMLDFGPGFYTTTNREQAVRFPKGLSGAQVSELFERYGVSKFIIDYFELLHIEREENMIAAVDEFIASQKSKS